MSDTILVIGSGGQIGTELVEQLRQLHGRERVIASDLRVPEDELLQGGPFEVLDALDAKRLHEVIKKHKVTEVYLLAALLSATAEQKPELGWKLNMDSLFHVLEMGKEKILKKIYWPSSIAVFGPTTPRDHTPQYTVIEPATVYGISKFAGERWCEWYFKKHGVDVRSLRYPGLIGYKSPPGGGTTDYAVHIFHEALKKGTYECFLAEDTTLPMMYMPDAIRATLELMHAPAEVVQIRGSYNLAGFSFSPAQIAQELRRHIPDFSISYKPDFRQAIAESWPRSIDDSYAREHWSWKPEYDLASMTNDMLANLKAVYA